MGAPDHPVEGVLWRADRAQLIRIAPAGTRARSSAARRPDVAHRRRVEGRALDAYASRCGRGRRCSASAACAVAVWQGQASERASLKSVSPGWIDLAEAAWTRPRRCTARSRAPPPSRCSPGRASGARWRRRPSATRPGRRSACRPGTSAGPGLLVVFHAALPAPRVPLLLHAALGREGAQLREELTRVASFLQLRWRERVLAPDHLAAVCELLAAALEKATSASPTSCASATCTRGAWWRASASQPTRCSPSSTPSRRTSTSPHPDSAGIDTPSLRRQGPPHPGLMAPVGTKRPSARSEPARTPALLHPDVVVGRLSEILQQVANPVANTLADVGTYSGRPLAQLFPTPKTLPEVTVTGRWTLPGLISEDLVFPSLHVPLEPEFRRRYREQYRETHLVYARRIRPRSARGRPRLLYLHGYMQPETVIEELALLAGMALRLDVEVIQMQPPYHGRRTPRGSRFSGEFYWTADLVRSVEALRQTLLDARTLLDWLLAEDPRPVGVTGLSLGGALTASAHLPGRALRVLDSAHRPHGPGRVGRRRAGARHDAARAPLRSAGVVGSSGASSPASAGTSCRPSCPPSRCCCSPPPTIASSSRASSSDVDAVGQTGDPLVPHQPHGLHRPPAGRAAGDASVHRPLGQ